MYRMSVSFVLFVLLLSNLLIQKTCAQTYCLGDSILLNAQNYISGDVQWQKSTDSIIWLDIQGATTISYMIYPHNSYYYRLLVTDSNCLPPYPTPVKFIKITPHPTTSNAGSSQFNISGNSIVLSGNNPINGIGTWSIISGTGGGFDDIHNPAAKFYGMTEQSYILRWTINNECGSSFDEITVSFAAFSCGNTYTDVRNGQDYPTVSIGYQCWMGKNLNIGQMVIGAQNQIDNQIIEKYCYGDIASNCDIYGGLYQWNEMMGYVITEGVQGICPTGWHIPSDGEWKQLEMALGMSQAEADMANTWRGAGVGTALLSGGNTNFDALLGGGRWSNGTFLYASQMGYYWTSTQSGANAWRRCFSSTANTVGRWDTFSKLFGFNVRCVRNL